MYKSLVIDSISKLTGLCSDDCNTRAGDHRYRYSRLVSDCVITDMEPHVSVSELDVGVNELECAMSRCGILRLSIVIL